MTGSPARYFLLAGVAAAIFAPGISVAQLQLNRPTPQIDRPAAPAPAPETPAPDDAGSDPAAPPLETVAPRPLEKSGITVNRLDSLDPDANGLLSEAQGGFPPTLWQGTDWGLVRTLMPRMPAGSPGAVVRSLARRLLLSRAAVPASKPVSASFIALRVDRLLAMGDIDRALALLKITPDERRDEALARTRVEALFFNNDNAGACAAVRNARDDYAGLYWSQAQAFCHALSGELSRASLIGDLLRERRDEIEPVFFEAMDALADARKGDTPALKSPRALHLAIMRAANLPVPAEIVQDGAVSVLRAVALSPNAALDIRLIAAEKAYRAGALSDDRIIRLYTGIDFSREQLNAPISAAEENWGPRTRALVLRSAASQKVALARAEVLRRAWQIGRERDSYAEIAGPSVPLVAEIAPAVELGWFAGDAARVLFSGGRLDAALAWYAIAARDREISDDARTAEAALWPLAALADSTNGVVLTDERLAAWFDARRQADPVLAAKQARTLYALLAALGRPISVAVWQTLLDAPFGSDENGLNVAWQSRLDSATAAGRLGETVLLATVGAAESAGGTLGLGDALRVISALRANGLENDARRLALETAVAAGL